AGYLGKGIADMCGGSIAVHCKFLSCQIKYLLKYFNFTASILTRQIGFVNWNFREKNRFPREFPAVFCRGRDLAAVFPSFDRRRLELLVFWAYLW
ncbi:MAG: hypothetical protein U0M10_02920, partial [Oscillospiraceae bacterium]|nr:hypothetical protein [Oscillospiraceae bacterium]